VQVRLLGHVQLALYKQCDSDVESLAWPSLETLRTHAHIFMLHKVIYNLVDINANLYLEPAVMRGKEAVCLYLMQESQFTSTAFSY